MSKRDSYILSAVAALGLLAAIWFLAIGPKRADLAKVDTEVEAAETSAATARQEALQFAEARLQFPTTYATIARLGKAVPADADVPSLLVQLEAAAKDAGVDFRKIELKSDQGDTGSSAPAPAPAPPPAGGATGPGGSTAEAGAQGAAAPAAPTAANSTAAAGATGAAASASTSAGASAPAPTPGAPAPANAVTAATLPIGANVGPAGFPIMRFEFNFQGSFFRMADLFHEVRSMVRRHNGTLRVSGRLLTVDGFSLEKGDKGFPQVKAIVASTAYLVPASQGLLGGATPQAPPGATQTTPQPVSDPGAASPPGAVVTTP